MKKKILGIVVMAAVALATGWNINQSNNDIQLSDLALDNVEALAWGEGGGGYDQWGYKLVNNCCKAYQPREYRCSTVWPDC